MKAEFFAVGHQLHVYDAAGNELGVIRQRLFSVLPCFDIEVDGEVKGSIQKKFAFIHPKYEVDFCGWHVEGDFLEWEYDVYEACSSVIHISKQWMHWGDTYILDFANPEDELTGLLLVLAIDAANCSK